MGTTSATGRESVRHDPQLAHGARIRHHLQVLQQSDEYCADVSRELGEPLLGTAAAETDLWIALEQAEPWGPKGLEDSALPPAVVEHLKRLGKAFPRLRVQLIRRPDRVPEAPALFLARTLEQSQELLEVPLASFDAILGLGLESWLSQGAWPSGAQRRNEPLFLVCVHGRRDRCCARRGMPVYSALRDQAGDRVWQTTHLGGHRFAATLAVLPAGICYGRVEASEAAPLLAAHQRGELHDLARIRGRSCYAPAVQAAEVLLRERLSERGLLALHFLRSEAVEGGTRVTFADARDQEHVVEVARQALAPAPASCGAAPKAGEGFVQLRSR